MTLSGSRSMAPHVDSVSYLNIVSTVLDIVSSVAIPDSERFLPRSVVAVSSLDGLLS